MKRLLIIVTILAKAGRITVGKGLKKGTYKLKIRVRAWGNINISAAEKKVTVKVQVR